MKIIDEEDEGNNGGDIYDLHTALAEKNEDDSGCKC